MEGLSNFVSTSFDVRRLLASETSGPDAVDYTCCGDAMADIPGSDCPTMTRDKSPPSTPSPDPTEGHDNTTAPSLAGKKIRLGLIQVLFQVGVVKSLGIRLEGNTTTVQWNIALRSPH